MREPIIPWVMREPPTPVTGIRPAMTSTGSPSPSAPNGRRPIVPRSTSIPGVCRPCPYGQSVRGACKRAVVAADAGTIVLRKLILTSTALCALALPAAADAAVTVQPDAATAGKFTRLDVRVPTERGVATERVVVELPPGFAFASYEPVAGWRIRMTPRELVQPLVIDGQSFDHEIGRITWTAETKADQIPPGGFRDFGLAVRIPDGEPGEKLTFSALQEYADGQIVRFVGAADSATPAPQVTLDNLPDPSTAATARAQAAAPVATAKDDAPSRELVIAALAAGGLGVLLGFAGWVRAGVR
jgi:uncharacterized protein YcnI